MLQEGKCDEKIAGQHCCVSSISLLYPSSSSLLSSIRFGSSSPLCRSMAHPFALCVLPGIHFLHILFTHLQKPLPHPSSSILIFSCPTHCSWHPIPSFLYPTILFFMFFFVFSLPSSCSFSPFFPSLPPSLPVLPCVFSPPLFVSFIYSLLHILWFSLYSCFLFTLPPKLTILLSHPSLICQFLLLLSSSLLPVLIYNHNSITLALNSAPSLTSPSWQWLLLSFEDVISCAAPAAPAGFYFFKIKNQISDAVQISLFKHGSFYWIV